MRKRWRVTVANPRKNDGPNYYLRLYPPTGAVDEHGQPLRDGTRVSSGTADRDEAEAMSKETEARLNAHLPAEERPLHLADVIERFMSFSERTGAMRPSTIVNYRAAMSRLSPLLGDVSADGLTPELIARAQDTLRESYADNTVRSTISCASRAVNWAHERGFVRSPWPHVKRVSPERTSKRPLTDHEADEVLADVREHESYWLPLFSLLADTGCRVGELCALRGRDVRHDECEIHLPTSKTGEPRTFAVPPETMALVPRVGSDERVFKPVRPAYRDRPVRPRVVLQVLRRSLKRLGITDSERLDTHSFRRRYVSSSLRAGTPLPISMKQLGHSSPAVHLEYQRRTAGDDLHEAVRRVRERRVTSRVTSRLTSQRSAQEREEGAPNSKKTPPLSLDPASC